MHSTEDIITRIIDLDSQAEKIRSQARADAAKIHKDTLQRIENEKAALEKQIAEKTAGIQAEAEKKREAELSQVRKEFSWMAESVKNLPPEKIEHSIQLILSRIKGQTL